MFSQVVKEMNTSKSRRKRTGSRVRSVGGNALITLSLRSVRRQVNEMAGGGQAGELKEDKLDKGMQMLLFGATGNSTDRQCSD